MNDYIERFRAALRIKTDWPAAAKAGDSAAIAEAEAALTQFQDFLVETCPLFHQYAERTVMSPYAVVYRWPGCANNGGNANAADALPVLLTGHYDVVPVETAKWSVDPFGAEIKDGGSVKDCTSPSEKYIYGRGALDMKNIIMAMMESAEELCRRGFKPARDVWIVFGGDEERSGTRGAVETAKWFAAKGINFSFVLDEGPSIMKDQIKGIDKPLALVGIEEKGYLSLDLIVEQKPGHASQPPEEQAAAVLARALLRLSRRPFPWLLTPAVEAFYKELGNHAPGITGFVMKHARLLGPLFFKTIAASPAARAQLRNTVAMTQLEGSAADNVMPSSVRAVINLRLLPPWTVEKAVERVRAVIADRRVSVGVNGTGSNPTEAGPGQAEQTSPGWKEIKTALAQSAPGIPAIPSLMPATTDSRHYRELAGYIYRFCPQIIDQEEISRVHGHDERVSTQNLEHALKFYTALMEQL